METPQPRTGAGRRRRRKIERVQARYARLQAAVLALYEAAYWGPDRYVENEAALWTELRDAAGIEIGTKTGFLSQGEMEEV